MIVIYFQLTNIVFLNVSALSKEIVKFLVFSTLLGDFTNPIYIGLRECETRKKETNNERMKERKIERMKERNKERKNE